MTYIVQIISFKKSGGQTCEKILSFRHSSWALRSLTSMASETNLKIDIPTTDSLKKSPLPPDSPLLRPSTPQSPASRRARELQREAKKARNFRNSRSGSRSRGGTPVPNAACKKPLTGSELSFSIKPSVGGRKGWKIMPESGGAEPETDPEILQRVIDMIHEMEFSGRTVPERITLKV